MANRSLRRAPFSDNPRVGARGQRTRQRILDAALQLFGDEGFHQCSIARISEQASCSRVSFYQYFSGKEDVFSSLAGQVARQISASTEAIDPLTPEAGGLGGPPRLGRPVRGHPRALRADLPGAPGGVRGGRRADTPAAARLRDQSVARIRSKLSTSDLPARQLDPLLALLLACLARTLDDAATLRAVAPEDYSRERVEVAFTDVMHRSLFGRSAVNVHAGSPLVRRASSSGPVVRDMLEKEEAIRSGDRQARRPEGAGARTVGTCSSSGATTPPGWTTWLPRPGSPTGSSTATSRTRTSWRSCSRCRRCAPSPTPSSRSPT